MDKKKSLHPKFALDTNGNTRILKDVCFQNMELLLINIKERERDLRKSMPTGAKILIFPNKIIYQDTLNSKVLLMLSA